MPGRKAPICLGEVQKSTYYFQQPLFPLHQGTDGFRRGVWSVLLGN